MLRHFALISLIAVSAAAQGTAADYQRAASVRQRLDGLVVDAVDTAAWIGSSNRLWYRKSITGGSTFMLVDAATRTCRDGSSRPAHRCGASSSPPDRSPSR